MRRILEEGHEVANHTYSHRYPEEMDATEIGEEVARCSQVLLEITGKRPTWFRPPGGLLTGAHVEAAETEGLRIAMWSQCLESDISPDPIARARDLARQVEFGDIILAHDGRRDRSATVEALPVLLTELQKRGVAVRTLQEIVD